MAMTHTELVARAERWLRSAGCSVVLTELKAATGTGETPDAIGWHSRTTLLIECKTTRASFLADHRKPFRLEPDAGMGEYRYYLAPRGVINPEDLPDGWGLLEASPTMIKHIVGYEPRTRRDYRFWNKDCNRIAETAMLLSALGRLKDGLGEAEFCRLAHARGGRSRGDRHTSTDNEKIT